MPHKSLFQIHPLTTVDDLTSTHHDFSYLRLPSKEKSFQKDFATFRFSLRRGAGICGNNTLPPKSLHPYIKRGNNLNASAKVFPLLRLFLGVLSRYIFSPAFVPSRTYEYSISLVCKRNTFFLPLRKKRRSHFSSSIWMSSFWFLGRKDTSGYFQTTRMFMLCFMTALFGEGFHRGTSLLNPSPALNVHLMADIWGPSSLCAVVIYVPQTKVLGGSSELNCLYRLGTVRYLKALITHIVPSKMCFHMEIYCFVKSDKNGAGNSGICVN